MRKALFFSIILVLTGVTNACAIRLNETVKGSGNVVSEERTVGDFSRIEVSRSIQVVLTQGALKPIQVKAEDNLMEYIQTEVRGNTLVISLPNRLNVNTNKGIYVYVSTPRIDALSVSTSADIKGTNTLDVDNLRLDGSTSGSINVKVTAQKINIELSTSADIELSGTAEEVEAECSTSGSISAQELVTQYADIEVSTSADVDITVIQEIKGVATTGGGIRYWGNPPTHRMTSSTGGSIKARD